MALAMVLTPVAVLAASTAPAAANTYHREYENRNWQEDWDGTATDQTWTRLIGDDGGSQWVEQDWWCEASNYYVLRNRPIETDHGWEANWVWVLEGTGPC